MMEILIGILIFDLIYVCVKPFTTAGTTYDLLTKPKVRKMYKEICDKKLSKNCSPADLKKWGEIKKEIEDLEYYIIGAETLSEEEVKRLIVIGKASENNNL